MKRFQWAIAMLLLALAQCAYADSIPTFFTQATMPISTNFSGDNMTITLFGPGVGIFGGGDAVACNWCHSGQFSNTPGSSVTPDIGFIDFPSAQGSVSLDGNAYAVLGLNATSLTALGSFTFPTNGKGFTVTLPAVLNPIIGDVGTGQLFNLEIPPGRLVLAFDFESQSPGGPPAYYQFTRGFFSTTPEPGTLGLMATGLAAIVGVIRRKRDCGCSPK